MLLELLAFFSAFPTFSDLGEQPGAAAGGGGGPSNYVDEGGVNNYVAENNIDVYITEF
jgi:hypothetical protein